MARFAGEIVFAAALALCVHLSSAQTSGPSVGFGGGKTDASLRVRREIEQLTPEQKQRLQENLKRWQTLSPEEKDLLRQREATAQQKLHQAAEESLKTSRLSLEPDRQQAYVARYLQERRSIEFQLRSEAQLKRKPLVQEMTSKLNALFAGKTADSPEGGPFEPGFGAQLSPEQKQTIFERLDKWRQSSQAENPLQNLHREKWKAEIMRQVDDALKQSGLNLDEEDRKLYSWRYLMSRRRIEQSIRLEMEEKRRTRLNDLSMRLQTEFGSPAPAQSTPGQ